MEVTSTVPAPTTVILAAVREGFVLIDRWEDAPAPNGLIRCCLHFCYRRLMQGCGVCFVEICCDWLVPSVTTVKVKQSLYRSGQTLFAGGT